MSPLCCADTLQSASHKLSCVTGRRTAHREMMRICVWPHVHLKVKYQYCIFTHLLDWKRSSKIMWIMNLFTADWFTVIFSFLPSFPILEDFKCKDRRSCISRNLVCDGRSHCRDSSDEVDCPTVASPAARANILKCRTGSKPCKDGTECVLYSHVCDGEKDCRDGSDEQGCGEFLKT